MPFSIESITLVNVKPLSKTVSAKETERRPSMCRSCGAIVGGGESHCAVCGAPVAQPQNTRPQSRPMAVPDRETLRFARAVLNRPYKFTVVLLIANFFMFLLMWESSGMSGSALWVFPAPVLLAYGAKLNYYIREQHQLWRFVTPMFLHVGLLHLLVNMYSLWIVGPYVEKLYGSAKFIFFWVVTGIVGVLGSYITVLSGPIPAGPLGRFLFRSVDGPSAGASGALFGLVGVLFVFGIKFRHELPEGFKRAFGTGMLPIIIINLFIGYMARGVIDNGAHLGGLLSGAALATVVSYRRPGESKGVALVWRVLQVAALALVVLSFLKVVQHFRDPIPPQVMQTVVPVQQPSNHLQYFLVMNDAQEALIEFLHDNNSGRLEIAIRNLANVPPVDQTADQLREQLRKLLIRGKDISAHTDAKALQQEKEILLKDFTTWT
ncbi:MAG TPA: rhomboid family intramembrane serine protease, partial [Pyrinomonadaceae bacterium]